MDVWKKHWSTAEWREYLLLKDLGPKPTWSVNAPAQAVIWEHRNLSPILRTLCSGS